MIRISEHELRNAVTVTEALCICVVAILLNLHSVNLGASVIRIISSPEQNQRRSHHVLETSHRYILCNDSLKALVLFRRVLSNSGSLTPNSHSRSPQIPTLDGDSERLDGAMMTVLLLLNLQMRQA